MQKYEVTHIKEEWEKLLDNTRKGSLIVKKVIRSLILLNADLGRITEKPQTNEDVCNV